MAVELGARCECVHFDLPREEVFARVRARVDHVGGVEGEGGVRAVKRMLGGKANAPPATADGYAKVTRCVNAWEQDNAAAAYASLAPPRVGWMAAGPSAATGEGTEGIRVAEKPENQRTKTVEETTKKRPGPDAFAVMMGAAKSAASPAKSAAKSSVAKTNPRPRRGPGASST